MTAICLYFHVHQPYRIKPYQVFSIGQDHTYFNYSEVGSNLDNKAILRKVTDKSYLPATQLIKRLLKKHPEFKVSFSISGLVIEQLKEVAPEVIKEFQKLAETGQVEFLAETYYHSLASLYSPQEFTRQVKLHHQMVKDLFNQSPTAFRNTELIYNNEIAQWAESLGYQVILAEGADQILDWRTPNAIYRPTGTNNISLLLKNYRKSDDIAFRYSDKNWSHYPLTADKYATWIHQLIPESQVINLFMDYETLGEHHWQETGIFDFLEQLPSALLKHPELEFLTVSQAAQKYPAIEELDIPIYTSWADTERDISAWRGNALQHSALERLYKLEPDIIASNDSKLIHDWRKLQTSDHFHYMSTKSQDDGMVHDYFSPYESPYDAFTNFMNVLQDIEYRIKRSNTQSTTAKPSPSLEEKMERVSF